MASLRFGRSAIAIAAGLVLGAGAIMPMAMAMLPEQVAARAIARPVARSVTLVPIQVMLHF